jgi:hypothetical protein
VALAGVHLLVGGLETRGLGRDGRIVACFFVGRRGGRLVRVIGLRDGLQLRRGFGLRSEELEFVRNGGVNKQTLADTAASRDERRRGGDIVGMPPRIVAMYSESTKL